MYRTLLLCALCIGISACSQDVAGPSPSDSESAIANPLAGLEAFSVSNPHGSSETLEEVQARLRSNMEGRDVVAKAFYTTTDAVSAAEALEAQLPTLDTRVRYAAQEIGALALLELRLNYPLGQQEAELAIQQVQLLSDRGSIEAAVIVEALDHIGPHMEAETRIDIAQRTLNATRSSTSYKDMESMPGHPTATGAYQPYTSSALERLDVYATEEAGSPKAEV